MEWSAKILSVEKVTLEGTVTMQFSISADGEVVIQSVEATGPSVDIQQVIQAKVLAFAQAYEVPLPGVGDVLQIGLPA